MHIAFVVADDERVRVTRRRRHVAQPQRLLPPELRAGLAIERNDGIEFARHVDVVDVGAQACVRRQVLLPDHDAGLEIDADGAAVIADDVDIVADDRRARR